jgi:hypothetical protein
MIKEQSIPGLTEAPSAKKIGVAALFALCIAVFLLFIIVLPAEYGIDLVGSGRVLGLTDLAKSDTGSLDLEALAKAAPVPIGNRELKTAPVLTGWNRDHSYQYRTDSRKFELGPGGKMEFKYQLRKGDGMVYSWDAPIKVRYEFHGEPNAGPNGTYESYAKDYEGGAEHEMGSFTAPFSGIHGWYWENTTQSPIVINLHSAGFYKGAEEFRENGSKFIAIEETK